MSLFDVIGDRNIIILSFIVPFIFLLLFAVLDDNKDKKRWILPVLYMYGWLFFLIILILRGYI